MKKIGKFNLSEENACDIDICKCEWNLTIGGNNPKDLKTIKKFLRYFNNYESWVLMSKPEKIK